MTFEILCVTMNQKDFSKIEKMNIHSNIVFANQANEVSYNEIKHNNHYAKMITTNTIGVGKNRNLAMMYSSADICLIADDDLVYVDDLEKIILDEFFHHPKADIIIFHLDTDGENRKQISYKNTRKHHRYENMPWGAIRICYKKSSIDKANLHFTELFGGGCKYPSGEDSIWLLDAKKAGLTFYVSNKTIGKVSFEESSWFTGYDDKYYFAKGAYYAAVHKKSIFIWYMYFLFRTRNFGELNIKRKWKMMRLGSKAYNNYKTFDECKNN